jgi:hypothetical protein
MYNYLFFRLLHLKIYEPVYWAKIFITCIEVILFLPIGFAILKGYFGCETYYKIVNGWISYTIFSITGLILLSINFNYYSPTKIKSLKSKYSDESPKKRNIKLFLILSFLLAFFIFSPDFVKLFLSVPKC